jgi:hypothetical protein
LQVDEPASTTTAAASPRSARPIDEIEIYYISMSKQAAELAPILR